MSRDAADLVAELRALSTADRLVDASVVVGTPTDHRCGGCHRLPVAFVTFDEAVGLRDLRYELDLCAGCARQVIGRTESDYVDVDVYVPAAPR